MTVSLYALSLILLNFQNILGLDVLWSSKENLNWTSKILKLHIYDLQYAVKKIPIWIHIQYTSFSPVSPCHPSSSLTCKQPIFRLLHYAHTVKAKVNNIFSFLLLRV